MYSSVDEQTPPVSLTLNHLPFQGRHGRFALRADSIRPYSSGGEAAAIHRTTQLRALREAKSLPYRTQKLSVFSVYVTGRVREPTYRYKPRAALSGGIAARLRSFRFISVSLPGRFGNQRIGTGSVRHCPAALPPPFCISFREAWPRLVFFTFTGYNALVTFLKGAFRCKQKKMK